MKVTFDLVDQTECMNVIAVIDHWHPELMASFGAPVADVEDEVTDEHIKEAEEKEDAPVEDAPSGSGPTSEPEEPAIAVSLDVLKTHITGFLKSFPDAGEMMGHRQKLISIINEKYGVTATDEIPTDKLDEAHGLLSTYIKENRNG